MHSFSSPIRFLQIDGVDSAFTREKEVSVKPTKQAAAEGSQKVEEKQKIFPAKKTDFSIVGSKAQLQIAMALTGEEPDAADFDNFPLPSAKEIAALKKKAEEEARRKEEEARRERFWRSRDEWVICPHTGKATIKKSSHKSIDQAGLETTKNSCEDSQL